MIFLVGRHDFVPDLQEQVELQLRSLRGQGHRMQLFIASVQEIVDGLLGLGLGLLDAADHVLEHGLKRRRAPGRGRVSPACARGTLIEPEWRNRD